MRQTSQTAVLAVPETREIFLCKIPTVSCTADMAVAVLYHLYEGIQSIFSTSTSLTAFVTIALSCLLATLWQSKHMPVKSAKSGSVAQAK